MTVNQRTEPRRHGDTKLRAFASLWLTAFWAAGARGADVADRAARAELARVKGELRAEGYPGAYHAALTLWDFEDWDHWSGMGAGRAESRMKQRVALADVRVGSRELDNHPVSPKPDYLGTPVPRGEDEFALRHALWRHLDGAYKSAVSDFLRKQAQLVSRGKAEYDTDDLSEEAPSRARAGPAPRWDEGRLRRLEEALAAPFREAPSLLHAESHVRLRRLLVRRRDTDGTSVDKREDWARIEMEAAAPSPDGLRQAVWRSWAAREPSELPSEAELGRAGREMLEDLRELQAAASTSPFSAPALLDPSVSAALAFALAQRLSGEEQRNPAGAQTFRGRSGRRVLPEDLSLSDDPTRGEFLGRPLLGRYAHDDQGVPARPVTLVDKGVLTGFLLSRFPVNGQPRSNGHGRAMIGQAPAGAPGNLFLTTSRPRPVPELLEALRAECRRRGKRYGLWVRRLRGASQQQGASGQGSVRVSARIDLVPADGGAPVRARDLDLVGTPLALIEGVLGAGDDPAVVDGPADFPPASVVAPSLLLADAELQRAETKPERPPLLPPPDAEKR